MMFPIEDKKYYLENICSFGKYIDDILQENN